MSKKLQHLAIIMDGNRRWAKEKGLASYKGHQAGRENVKKVIEWCQQSDIKILTLYAFSAENWQRPKREVDFLMKSFCQAFRQEIKELNKENIKINVFGRLSDLSNELQKLIKQATDLTKDNTQGILNLCINYSGRLELVDAFNSIKKQKASDQDINEEDIKHHLYGKDMPEPDLIIRTSGEKRLSGFLLWQAAYSELLFIDKYWPDFSKDDFDSAVDCFHQRKRRFGC